MKMRFRPWWKILNVMHSNLDLEGGRDRMGFYMQ